ncbi:TPA: hypothetical protein ACT9ME_001503, partial [Legionella pneumophila]
QTPDFIFRKSKSYITKEEFISLCNSASQDSYSTSVFKEQFASSPRALIFACEKLAKFPNILLEERLSAQGIILAYLERMAQKIYDQYCAHKQGDGSIKPISLLTEFTTDEGPFTERIHKTIKLCDTEEDKLFVWAVKVLSEQMIMQSRIVTVSLYTMHVKQL